MFKIKKNKLHKLSWILTFTLLCFITTSLYSQSPVSKTKIKLPAKIKSVLANPILDQTSYGIKIVNLTKNEVLYEHNSEKLLRPASVLKLLTTAAAYELLDTNFQFRTEVLINPDQLIIRDSILNGDLYIKGYGDPLLTTKDLDTLAKLVTSTGIKSVEGNIIGDVSYFDDMVWGKGWMWDDEPESFAAFISPLTINSNSINIFVSPSTIIGDPVIVHLENLTSDIEISNNAITSKIKSEIENPLQSELTVIRKSRDNKINISGEMQIGSSKKEFALSIWKPEIYFLNLFKQRLSNVGITIQKEIIIDSISSGSVAASINRNLDTVISEINKNSNNLATENLLKTLSAEILGIRGKAENGIILIKSYLHNIGIDTFKILIVDGSGVSRYNLISAGSVIHLLQYIYKTKYFEKYKSSLAIAGTDGTLKNRFVNTKSKTNLRGKTGTHSDVSSLAGYVKTKKGDTLGFCIIINNYIGKPKDYRHIVDQICTILFDS